MIKRLLLAAMLLVPVAAFADSSALILTSVAGSPEHEKKFTAWSEGTRAALIDKLNFSADRVVTLSGKGATRDAIQKAFVQLKGQLKPADAFFLFFIGHGSYDEAYKFNITGPDLTAAEYSTLLGTLGPARIVIVNGTSASGGAIEALAGKNRVVVTATKAGGEGNETYFYEYFLDSLLNAEADEDKDKKISVWEAFKFANAAVERFFKEQGRLATEHSQISDNGAEPTNAAIKDPPLLARSTSFLVNRPVTVSDPKLQAMLNEKSELEQKIDALRLNKSAMPEAEYERQMESLLVELALKNQQIRAQGTK